MSKERGRKVEWIEKVGITERKMVKERREMIIKKNGEIRTQATR
jgi:hypothetical protein